MELFAGTIKLTLCPLYAGNMELFAGTIKLTLCPLYAGNMELFAGTIKLTLCPLCGWDGDRAGRPECRRPGAGQARGDKS